MIIQVQVKPVRFMDIISKHCVRADHQYETWRLLGEWSHNPEIRFRVSRSPVQVFIRMVTVRKNHLSDREKKKFAALERDLQKYGFLDGQLVIRYTIKRKDI